MEWMLSTKEDDDNKPSTDSNNREERIEARRLRIQRRNRKQRMGSLVKPEEIPEAKTTKMNREQVERSRLYLDRMNEEILETVTNVRTAYWKREYMRKSNLTEEARELKDKMDAESKNATERFDDILRKWEMLREKHVARELLDLMEQQNEICDSVIWEKDKLISDLQQDIKSKDDDIVKDLTKQSVDVDEILMRMSKQYKRAVDSYTAELKNVESSFLRQRDAQIEEHQAKWKRFMERRRNRENFHLYERLKRLDEHDKRMEEEKQILDEEQFDLKVKLYGDVDILQGQLEKTKAAYVLSIEKLEYNYQVIVKREQENQMMKALQKRKFTRNTDTLTHLRQKAAKQEKAFRQENHELTSDIKRYTRLFDELQSISSRFHKEDMNNYTGVWVMNEEKCKEYFIGIINIDKTLTEEHFGMNYSHFSLDILKNVGPFKLEKLRQRGGAVPLLEKVFPQAVVFSEKDETREEQTPKDDAAKDDANQENEIGSNPRMASLLQAEDRFSYRALRSLLEMVCDEAGFLVDRKLLTILNHLPKDNRCLMTLDAIFAALKISAEDDIHLMARYFTVHAMEEDELSRRMKEEASAELLYDTDMINFDVDTGDIEEAEEEEEEEGDDEDDDEEVHPEKESKVSSKSDNAVTQEKKKESTDETDESPQTQTDEKTSSTNDDSLSSGEKSHKKKKRRKSSFKVRSDDEPTRPRPHTVAGDRVTFQEEKAAQGKQIRGSLAGQGRASVAGQGRPGTAGQGRASVAEQSRGSLAADQGRGSFAGAQGKPRPSVTPEKYEPNEKAIRHSFRSDLARTSTLSPEPPKLPLQRSVSAAPQLARSELDSRLGLSTLLGTHATETGLKEIPPQLTERKPGVAHANDVIKVLKRFLNDLRFSKDTGSQIDTFFLAQYETRNPEYDTHYWNAFLRVSDEIIKESVWEVILETFTKYEMQLKHRHSINKKVLNLRRQNEELRHLLLNYVTSPKNKDFLVAPTHTMHMQDIEYIMERYKVLSNKEEELEQETDEESKPSPRRHVNSPRVELVPKKFTLQ